MSYSGDTSLSNEIKERILTTFEQALDLSEGGSRKEALLGCDFVLRLDPLFEPARVLHRRLRDTEADVETADLRDALASEARSAVAEGAPPAVDGPPEAAEPGEPAPTEPPPLVDADTDAGESFADRVEAQLDASFGLRTPATDEPSEEEPDLGALSPDTDLSEPSLSGPSLSGPEEPTIDAPPEIPDPARESAALGPEGLPLEDGGSDLDAVNEPLGAPVQLDAESQRRIAELLDEGQDSFDIGEYQSAIDSWSRVFLIDIDHKEANRRIEEARRMSAETERQIEEVFHEAMSRLDEGDLEASREALNRVLQMQPTHLAALEYLERIDSGDAAHPEFTDPVDIGGEPDLGFGSEPLAESEESDSLFLTPDLPPLPEDEIDSSTAPVKPPPKPRRKRDPRRLFISVGSAVLVLVLIGGWFLYDNWSLFFPNSQSAQDVPPPLRIDPIRRAQALHDEGKTTIAIAQLRRLPPGDPHYAEAQALVAQWETTAVDIQPQGPTPEALEGFRALVANARSAHGNGENLLAAELLERAAAIAPLDDDSLAIQADTEANLAALRDQIQIFRSGDWEYALPALWRMRETDLDNADVTRLIVDCYYNLGVRDLQRGRPESAMRKFEEALNLRSSDRTLIRLRALADTYRTRPEDLLYRIYVKYLPFR